MILIYIVVLWVVPVFVAVTIGNHKRRAGLLYGLFLGWLGVLILAVLPSAPPMTLERLEKKRRQIGEGRYQKAKAALEAERGRHRECPHCKEQMRSDASVCPHCQRDVDPQVEPAAAATG